MRGGGSCTWSLYLLAAVYRPPRNRVLGLNRSAGYRACETYLRIFPVIVPLSCANVARVKDTLDSAESSEFLLLHHLSSRCFRSFSFSLQMFSISSSVGSRFAVRFTTHGFLNAPGSSTVISRSRWPRSGRR